MVGEQLGCWQRRCTCCAKRHETHGASIGVRQGSTTQRTTSSSRHKQKLPASSIPPVLKPRLNDGLFCVAVFALLKHALGFLFTLFVICVLIASVPVVFLARFVRCARSRFTHKLFTPHNHCDAWWPLQGTAPFRAVITTQSALDQNLLSSQLTRVFLDQESTTRCGCDAYRDIERSEPTPEVRIWDQQRTRLKMVGELMRVLNDASSIHAQSQSPSSVLLVPDFTNVVHIDSCCCLAIFSHDCYSFTFCLPRLLSLYTNGQLIFDMEPKMGESFSPQRAEFTVMLKLCHIVAQTIQFTCVGPLSVAAMCLRRENPIWRELLNESSIASLNRRKNEVVDGDETIPMESVDAEKKGVGRLYRWMRLANADQLLRAERILRAATVELFLAFVAGAIRRHFRSSGIAHPPDVGATVPVSYREYVPVEAQKACDMMLLPLQIPSGVEGAIPRVWAVQRRLAGALDGVLPFALRVSS
uniref:Uncharacterized protein n=1 Tax=Parascaris univalens TaxID=6257 RepID=A0A915BJZ3_PARUN